MTVQRRDRTAREEAVTRYEHHYEHFAESAQLYASVPTLSRTIADVALMFLCAADAERNDPAPRFWPECHCAGCAAYRLIPDHAKLPHPSEAT